MKPGKAAAFVSAVIASVLSISLAAESSTIECDFQAVSETITYFPSSQLVGRLAVREASRCVRVHTLNAMRFEGSDHNVSSRLTIQSPRTHVNAR